MYTKEFYISGADLGALQTLYSQLQGIISVELGTMTVRLESGQTESVSGLRLAYNPKWLDVSTILDMLYTVEEPQGAFYSAAEDIPQLQLYLTFASVKKKPALLTGEIIGFQIGK